jgi:hypothetical protein
MLTTLAGVPYDVRNGLNPGKKFFGFATKWSRAAREIVGSPTGEARGIFTLGLLSGLRGGAPADVNKQVKGIDLESYVINYVTKVRTDASEAEEDDGPEFDYAKPADLLFNAPPGEPPSNAPAAAPPLTPSVRPPDAYVVSVKPQNGAAALNFELTDGAYVPVPPILQSREEWKWRIAKVGLYKLKRSDGKSAIVEVIGDQEVIDANI